MTVLIDSNVIINFLKGTQSVVNKINDYILNKIPIFVATISVYEVYFGIIANHYLKKGKPARVPNLLVSYRQFISKCGILDFTFEAAEKAADLFAQSQGRGLTIKEKDCQIAGIALVHGIDEVFSYDNKDFPKIYDLTGLKYVV